MSKYTLKSLLVIISLTVAGNALAAMPAKQASEEEAMRAAIAESLQALAFKKAQQEARDFERAIKASKQAALEYAEIQAGIKESLKEAHKVALAQQKKQAQADADAKAAAQQNKKEADKPKAQVAPQIPAQAPAASAAPKAIQPMNVKQAQEVVGDCAICMDNKPLIKLSCGHALSCQDCFLPILHETIKTKNDKNLRCPEPKCHKELEMEDIYAITRGLISGKTSFSTQIAEIRTQNTLAKDQNKVVCPTPDCGTIYINDRKGVQPINCQKCNKVFCSQCSKQHNRSTTTCEQHRIASMTADERANEEWLKRVKPCPQCKSNIERIDGCNYMTCEKCKFGFCWLCLKKRQHNDIPSPDNCGCKLWQQVKPK